MVILLPMEAMEGEDPPKADSKYWICFALQCEPLFPHSLTCLLFNLTFILVLRVAVEQVQVELLVFRHVH